MARRQGGRGQRRVVPGIRDALLYRTRKMDGAFCLRPFREDCMWCQDVAALEGGQPRAFSGDRIWSALASYRQDAMGRSDRDLMGDTALYRIAGPDTIEAA